MLHKLWINFLRWLLKGTLRRARATRDLDRIKARFSTDPIVLTIAQMSEMTYQTLLQLTEQQEQ